MVGQADSATVNDRLAQNVQWGVGWRGCGWSQQRRHIPELTWAGSCLSALLAECVSLEKQMQATGCYQGNALEVGRVR